jgi:hypothetical protein
VTNEDTPAFKTSVVFGTFCPHSSAWPESNHLDQIVQDSLRIFTKSTASRFSTLEEFFTEAGNVLIPSQHYELPAIFTVFHIDAQGVPKFCVDFETSNT